MLDERQRLMPNNNRKVEICVVNGDATEVSADALILKYAQGHYGLDSIISSKFVSNGIHEKMFSPSNGEVTYLKTNDLIKSKNILVVGVKRLYEFSYPDIRKFARTALEKLGEKDNTINHAVITLHGAGYGLDELEAFESEVAGMIDAITAGTFPYSLKKISIVEFDQRRAKSLVKSLEKLIPGGYVQANLPSYLANIEESVSEKFRSIGYSSSDKPHIFVAMPFRNEMEDIYDYGIQNAVREAGYLCERADLSSFTGDVMEWVKKRIRSASLVIADLTNANPNVYLEVGYAWGAGIPTVLLAQEQDHLKFDVKGQRCILYGRIKELEEKLKSELIALKSEIII